MGRTMAVIGVVLLILLLATHPAIVGDAGKMALDMLDAVKSR